MLGYEQSDIDTMQAAIRIAKSYLPANSSNDAVRNGLEMANSFFDGLWAEGYLLPVIYCQWLMIYFPKQRRTNGTIFRKTGPTSTAHGRRWS